MARLALTVVALVAAVALVGGVSVADGNEPPLAEAGLDQTVVNGTTVYLDAGGSVDPDGAIATVAWEITGPDGTVVDPADDASVRTRFTPNRTGTYTANLTVTDDDGATRNDTLYVTVEETTGPSVGLLGPGETTPGTRTEFVVNASAGSANLSQLYWIENGSTERSVDLSGDDAMVTLNRSFSETRPYRLNATIVDTKGYSQTTSLLVYVGSGGGDGDYDHCPDGGSPYFGFDGDFIGCTGSDDADMIYEDRVLEQNGEDGIQLFNDNSELVEMVSTEEILSLQESMNSPLTRNTVQNSFVEDTQPNYNSRISNNTPRRYSSESEDSDSSEQSTGPTVSTPPLPPNYPSLKTSLLR